MGSHHQPFTLAILGAGIGGLALSIGLRKQNVHCTIYEAAPKFDAVGAGIGLGPNALKAMELMDPTFAKMYDEIKVGNTSKKRQHEQIEILGAEEGFGKNRGWEGGSVGHERFERSSAHRKALLEVMKTLVPEGTVRFGKRIVEIGQGRGDRKVEMRFEDGETVVVDALVGCDGIKGMTRRAVLHERYPEEVAAKYTHTYVYRGIAPMEDARAIMGEYAEDARWWMMEEKGWAMYPISQGREANIVAFMMDKKPWVGEQASREVSREEMLAEFVEYDKRLQRLLDWVKPIKWPLFHHPDTPTYINGRVVLLGDSAHASSPSQAAGAGQGLEDALVLSRLLGLVESTDELDAAFQAYDAVRRPRAQNVVQQSLEVGTAYFLVHPDFGNDLQKLTDDANKRLPLIWWHDLEGDCKIAENHFRELVKRSEGKEDCASKQLHIKEVL
ncbi:putative salicylate hydroxylase [Stipitochalara longipes BDJ]|nr:putative salicylate hydroxylase [Stipitochalara longipes BDJ]